MTRIVTMTYRPKRPPKKRKAVAIAGPGTGQRNAKLKIERTPPRGHDQGTRCQHRRDARSTTSPRCRSR